MAKITSIILTSILSIGIMCSLASCGHNLSAVKINDYVSIKTEGYDGLGTADYIFDSEAFANDYSDKIAFKTESGNESPSVYALDSLVNDIAEYGTLIQSENLSNGDEITFTWTFNPQTIEDKYEVDLEYSDIVYTVENLKEISTEDIFDKILINFLGISSVGTASLIIDNNSDMLSSNMFIIEPSNLLSNGDIVTVTLSDETEQYLLKTYGIKPLETSKEYTVDGLYTYEGLPDNTFDEINQLCLNAFYDEDYFMSSSEINNYMPGYPEYYVSVADEYGNVTLDTNEKTGVAFAGWAEKNAWLSERKLESIECIGNYLLINQSESKEAKDRLYLLYDVHFSQYGSTNENNPSPATGGRSDFEFYWCPFVYVDVIYNKDTLTCELNFTDEDDNFGGSNGNQLDNITYYIYDASTNPPSEDTLELSYFGFKTEKEAYNSIIDSQNDTFVLVNNKTE